jgi:hypothetical protein
VIWTLINLAVTKTRILLFAVLLAAALSTAFWLFSKRQHQPQKIEAKQQRFTPRPVKKGQATAATSSRTIPPKPRLFKVLDHPPTTPQHQAMWDWWRAMEKADPKFQWKMPIEFYGKVVDQFEEPVAEARVHIVWTAVDDSHEITKLSARDGAFELTGEQGKAMTVDVSKLGYLPAKGWIQNFEYAAFFDYKFHVSDKNNPVVFRLQKLMGAEPMLKFIANAQVNIAMPVVLNVETGKLGTDGDISFSIVTGPKRGQYGPDFSITITALNGAAFAPSEEEFMFHAPEVGYQTAAVINRLSSDANYSRVQPYRCYVKTRSGKYAAVTGEITIREGLGEGKASFHAIIYHNPSGSRNLEFDHRKWINR